MAPPKVPEENSKAIVADDMIAAVAIAAGFPKERIATMVAIALAESGGDATAVGRAVPSRPDYGLWQINFIHADILPGFFPPGTGWKSSSANANAAKKIYDMQGLNAWTVYNTGAYLRFMARGNTAAAKPSAGIDAPPEHSGENAIREVSIFDEEWWKLTFGFDMKQALWVGGGSILVLLGLVLYFRGQLIGGGIGSIAKAVTK